MRNAAANSPLSQPRGESGWEKPIQGTSCMPRNAASDDFSRKFYLLRRSLGVYARQDRVYSRISLAKLKALG